MLFFLAFVIFDSLDPTVIVDIDKCNSSINIPEQTTSILCQFSPFGSTIKHIKFEGKHVSHLAVSCFQMCIMLETINFEKCATLMQIPTLCFASCVNLRSIKIPSSVKSIGLMAFANCTSLAKLIFSSNSKCRSFLGSAFLNCCNLTCINLSKCMSIICEYSFAGCTSLKVVQASNGSVKFQTLNNVLYKYNARELVFYPPGLQETEFTVPESVTTIYGTAFILNRALRSVKFTKNLKKIGSYAFFRASNIKEMIIPDSVNQFGIFCFGEMFSLQSLVLPMKLSVLDVEALSSLFNLKALYMPRNKVKLVNMNKKNQKYLGCIKNIYCSSSIVYELEQYGARPDAIHPYEELFVCITSAKKSA